VTPFEVRVDRDGARSIVRVFGELDIATAPQLEKALETATAEGSALVVDLTETTFLDSTGLRTMVHAARAASGFTLVCPAENNAVLRVVTFAGFELAVPVVETLEQVDPPG
jgi:anti-sigma B factor antagonist